MTLLERRNLLRAKRMEIREAIDRCEACGRSTADLDEEFQKINAELKKVYAEARELGLTD